MVEGAYPYLIAAYAVVLGGLAAYALQLHRKLRALRRNSSGAPERGSSDSG